MSLDAKTLSLIIKEKIQSIEQHHKLFGQYIENREYDIDEGKVSAYQEILDCIKKLEE